MSGKQSGMVWDLDLPQPQKIVLLAMADHADHEGHNVFPSIGLIAWKTGYSVRQAQRIVDDLEKQNLVKLEQVNFGAYRTNYYSLHLENGKQKAKYTGRDSLPKDPKHVEAGKKARAARADKMSPHDTIVSPLPMTPLCHPPHDTIVSPYPSGHPGVEPSVSAKAENSAEDFDSQERAEKEKELQAKANAEFDAMPSASAGLPSRELTAAVADPHVELTELAEEIAAALDADLAHLPQAKTAARKMIVAYGDKARATLRSYLKNPKNREFVRDKNPNALVGLLQADYARSFKHNRHGGVLRTGVAYGG